MYVRNNKRRQKRLSGIVAVRWTMRLVCRNNDSVGDYTDTACALHTNSIRNPCKCTTMDVICVFFFVKIYGLLSYTHLRKKKKTRFLAFVICTDKKMIASENGPRQKNRRLKGFSYTSIASPTALLYYQLLPLTRVYFVIFIRTLI